MTAFDEKTSRTLSELKDTTSLNARLTSDDQAQDAKAYDRHNSEESGEEASKASSRTVPSVLIVAGEASSSLYAQRLLEKWQADGIEVEAFGIGSRQMEALGFECLGRSEELAVVGLQEVLAHLPQIRHVLNALVAQAEKRRPRFALLLDYPDFNFRLAKKLKHLGIRVIYYISPQLWAWRTSRIKLVQKYIDRMLVLFPFEEKFYRDRGISADFVGHPALDEMDASLFHTPLLLEKRHRYGIADDELVLALMPGSRRSEIKHHLRTQLEAARIVTLQSPKVRPVILVAPTLEREFIQEQIREQMGSVDFPVQLIKDEPLEMISLADIVLVASGTATLMVGLMEKPMVIMYRMNALTAFFARLLVRHTKYFGMVNLVMDRQVVPELFQDDANPERLAKEILVFANDPRHRENIRSELKDLKNRLGSRGATTEVARILSAYLERKTP